MAKKSKAASKSKASKSSKKAPAKKDWKGKRGHLFQKTPRDYRVGRNVQPKRDMSRMVKWPRYVRIQRQRAILKKRLKIPPALNHFTKTLDKNQAGTLFGLLAKYRTETKKEKKDRLFEAAKAEEQGANVQQGSKPKVLKYGINHIATLVENREAELVVIAHDVDPIEIVVWLPALCRLKKVPYCIVKGKARLGQLVQKKTVTAVALTDIRKEDQNTLTKLIESVKPMYNDSTDRSWGGGVMGVKAQAVVRRKQKEEEKEKAKALARM